MTDEPVGLAIQDGLAQITLSRPAVLNAIDAPMALGFERAVRTISERDDVRAILLRGEGRAFCAGGDVTQFAGEAVGVEDAIRRIITPLHAGLERLHALPQPSVAAVQGAVAGAGMSLMLACDLAIAADDARFTLAYSRIGATPDGSATYWLPRTVGPRKAKEIALLAETLPVEEAHRLGMVSRVVPRAVLDEEALALARRLAAGPTQAYGRIKELIHGSLATDLPTQLEAEEQAFLASTGTADFAEGVAAFLAKRPPTFRGR